LFDLSIAFIYTRTMSYSINSPVYSVTLPVSVSASTSATGLYINNTNGTNWSDIAATAPTSTISLKGEKADIDINGLSLKNTLEGMMERLALLQINPELEAEFEELKQLGERYRALEKELIEQKRVFDILKNTNIK
jgi:hypothetical protein